jgi:hypothetical protein
LIASIFEFDLPKQIVQPGIKCAIESVKESEAYFSSSTSKENNHFKAVGLCAKSK